MTPWFNDAILCMGGGYYPRPMSSSISICGGTLPEAYDSTASHLDPAMRSTIEHGSAAMAALLEANGG